MPTIRKLSIGAALFAAACGGALAQPATSVKDQGSAPGPDLFLP